MNKIKFVRYYKFYNSDAWDIVYKSGRIRTIVEEPLPRTAEHFVIMAKNKIEQYDKIFNRFETIWSN